MTAITLDRVGKRYVQSVDRPLLVRSVLGLERRRRREIWALREVSLECDRGQTLGIIGRNGSGKTTLLRLLAGVSAPTTGRLRIEGRVAPLIGIGVGFNPELTGRENVVVNGQLLGLTEPEVRARYGDIVDFAELGEFMDTPVKFYSSGMFLRLAFSVAIHTDPDVFLIDEVLAVGDAAFQARCLDRLRAAQARGTTIVLVTHNLGLLQRIAPRTLVLRGGRIAYDGDTDGALAAYQNLLHADRGEDADAASLLSGERGVIGGAQVTVDVVNEANQVVTSIDTGETITVRARVEFGREVDRPRVGLQLSTEELPGIFAVISHDGDYNGGHGPGRPLTVQVRLTNHLLARTYLVQVAVYERSGNSVVGESRPQALVVRPGPRIAGLVDLEPVMSIEGQVIDSGRVRRLSGSSGMADVVGEGRQSL